MKHCLVFNHHSLPFDDSVAVDLALPEFLKICIEAKNVGLSTILVAESIDQNWFRLPLTSDYYWQDWYQRHNQGEHRDMIRAFRSIATQSPFFSRNDMSDGADVYEVSLNGENKYDAVCAAAWHEAPLTGFATRSPWNESLLHTEAVFEQVKQSLGVLDAFSHDWSAGHHACYRTDLLREQGLPFEVSGESETVKNNPRLCKLREFWIPRGEKKYFEQHVKMSRGYRLHFYPDDETKNIHIGYVGPHLKLR
ncbi:MAG: hypothetical protein EOL87_07630 [Spartobacteria bacterium]|nr:hypothetical protein [Spartobacteria bacterium]